MGLGDRECSGSWRLTENCAAGESRRPVRHQPENDARRDPTVNEWGRMAQTLLNRAIQTAGAPQMRQ
jgi:hypothetical protein